MDVEQGVMTALLLGFLLGLKHATDADHVVAVSAIVNETRDAWKGFWIGASWGLGHTTPLLILGTAILVFKEVLLTRYESLAPFFEFGVGVMLILLGIQVFWNILRGRLHMHDHADESTPHVHIHGTHAPLTEQEATPHHRFFRPGKPILRLKSFSIGVVHGLAGSAAVILILLPNIQSFWVGLGYLVLFGLGTILSMTVITLILGVPFALTGNRTLLNKLVSGSAGAISVIFGAAIMIDTSLGVNFIPF